MNIGKTIAIVGGLYLFSQHKPGAAATVAKPATPGQQPKQSSSGGKTGAGAGQGGSATAGRGGAAKTGGGSSPILDIADVFPNFAGDSVIAGMLAAQNAGTDVPTPPLADFFQPADINGPGFDFLAPAAGGADGVPQFGGDQNLIDPVSGLVIDPSTGQPFGSDTPADALGPGGFFPDPFGPPEPEVSGDVVSITDQPSAIVTADDSVDVPPLDVPDIPADDFSF